MTKKFSQYLRWIKTNKKKLIDISDAIWKHAEIGFKEHESSKLLMKNLEEAGFNVDNGVASLPTAFVASYGSGKPVIAVLGEYDSLPGLNQAIDPTKKPLKEGAPGHGCGHNLLCTAGLGGVLAVKEAIDAGEVKGTIRYYGCPAEEIFASKAYMVNPGGLFEDVDISIAWHPQGFNAVRLSSNSAINSVIFKFHGQTAHAASDPYNGRSALDAVELMNVGVNYMREHVIPDARIHYVITNGGLAPNIVPDEAEVFYCIRAPERHQVDEIYDRLIKIAKGAELMTETSMEIEFLDGTHDHIRNQVVSDVIYEKMKQVGPPRFNEEEQEFARKIGKTLPPDALDGIKKAVPPNLKDLAMKVFNEPLCPIIIPPIGKGQVSTGCTDVGDVSWNTPLGEFWTACFAMGGSSHSWQATATSGMGIGHKGMLTAAKIIALTALEFMSNPELVEKARKEFENAAKEKRYKSPFPEGFKPPLHRLKYLIVR